MARIMAMRSGRALALCVRAAAVLGCCGPALALSGGSYAPPAGQLPATAPGGTEGLAGPRNVDEAIRGGHAYPAAPYGYHRVRRPPPGYEYGR